MGEMGVGGQWPRCLSLGTKLVLSEGNRNCLLVICFICIFIFACRQALRGPCLEKHCSEAGEGIF